MKRLIIFLLLFAAIKVAGQTTGYLRFDTVRIYKQGGTSELYLINSTKDSLGQLTNIGGGLTRFMRSRVLNDSTLIVGLDTLVIKGGAGGSGGGSGSVTSITQGYGIIATPNPITSTGTIDADSAALSLYYLRRKDSTLYATQYDLTQIVSGINELTGQVTAGPGTGSQVATIATNTVSNTNLRQGIATSVIGVAGTSTANVADIQGTIASTYLKRSASGLLFDSVGYEELKDLPPTFPGVYIGPAQSFNPGFLVIASGIAHPSNSFVHGTPITWEFLTQSSAHNYSFFDSVYGNSGNQRLAVRYPNVKNVLNVSMTIDESFTAQGIFAGATVGLTAFEAEVDRFHASGIRLTGAGTNTWTEQGTLGSLFDVTTYDAASGGTSFNTSVQFGTDYNAVNIQYIGPNNYHIRRVYSGLGAYNIRFVLVDEFNNPVTAFPTTSDEIIISNAGMNRQQVGMATWSATTNSWMSSAYNYWILGAFEVWMVAAPISSTSIQVRWQTVYVGATDYKILRSSTGLYGAYTLIHTGTEGIYTDAGLSANTIYHYKMQAVISGIDTDVTTFRTNTNF